MNIEANKTVDQNVIERSKNSKTLETYSKIGGFAGIIFGLIHVWSIISQGFSYIRAGDAVINITFGILLLVCARLLSKGKILAMWVFTLFILLSIGYSFVVGRGFNYSSAIIGLVVIFIFISLKNKKELS